MNESNKQDILFVSREGAARNANAAAYAPTLTLYIDNPVAATAPGAPTSATASTAGPDVKLTWAAPSSDGGAAVTGYRVYDDNGATVAQVAGDVRETMITGLAPATTRAYTATAVNAAGHSTGGA